MKPLHQLPATGAGQAEQNAKNAASMAKELNAAQQAGGAVRKILREMVSPLALATGAALGFVGVMVKAVTQSEALYRGLDRITRVNYYAPSFAKLLGGLDAAKRRLAEISALAAKGPFKFQDLADGNRRLEILTRGRLSGRKGNQLVGDAAAAGGTSFTEMASLMGTVYDDISNGREINFGVEQLRQLGVVSTDTANRLLLLRQSGISNAKMWAAVEEEVARSKGSMKSLAQEIAGLQERLNSTRENQDLSVGQMFEEGQKKGLEARIQMVESMTPVIQSALAPLALLHNAWNSLMLGMSKALDLIPGLRGAISTLVSTLVALAGALIAISLVQTIALVGVLTKSMFGWAVANQAAAGATGILARAVAGLRGALFALASPLGIAMLALAGIAGAMMNSANNSNIFSSKQRELRRELAETSKALQEQISGTKTQADRATNTSSAQKRVIALEEQIAEAKKEAKDQEKKWYNQGSIIGDYWNKTLFGTKSGEETSKENVEMLEKERERAMKDVMAAANAPTDSAVESLLGEDYAREKKASQEKISAFTKEFQTLAKRKADLSSEGKDTEDIDRQMQEVADKTAAEAERFSVENLNRRFERRQVAGGHRVRLMREVSRRTGNTEWRDRADADEDSLFRERRIRDHTQMGFDEGTAKSMAEDEMLFQQLDRTRERTGVPQAASLAEIGGAAGFAGVVSDIPKQQLDRLVAIENKLAAMQGVLGEDKFKEDF